MSKYHAKRCEMDGFKFDSLAEMRRYQELRLLEKAGRVSHLQVHPVWDLFVRSLHGRGEIERLTTYEADFHYFDADISRWITEDVKGVRTPMYRLKRKWVKAEYGIDITEVEV